METDNTSLYIPKTLTDAIRHFSDPDVAHNFVATLRWPDGVVCPYCSGRSFYFIRASRKYHCKECKKRFSVKVGSIMEDSPLSLDKWLVAMWMLTGARNGISSCEIARALGIQQKSAWFLMHRIRYVMQTGSMEKMSGTVEADEMAVGGLEKNKHQKKRGNVGGGSAGKEIVLGLYEHGGEVRTQHVVYEEHKTLFARVREYVAEGSTLYTDTASTYKHMDKHYSHTAVNHKVGQYVKGSATTNHMENVWSCYKRALKGSYIHVSPKHLNLYLSEMDCRYNVRGYKDGERFAMTVASLNGKRLDYDTLVNGYSEKRPIQLRLSIDGKDWQGRC